MNMDNVDVGVTGDRRVKIVFEIRSGTHDLFIGPQYATVNEAILARQTARLWLDAGVSIRHVDQMLHAMTRIGEGNPIA